MQVVPAAARSRSHADSRAASSPVSAAVGSSSTSTLRVVLQRAHDLDDLLQPDAERRHRRAHVDRSSPKPKR